MDKSRYPADWRAISDDIRFNRAGGKCEQCGAPHKAPILRSDIDPSKYIVYDFETDTYHTPDGVDVQELHEEIPEEYDHDKFTWVVLTVHHIGIDKPDGTPGDTADKMDVRPENLIALCQRCHLQADLVHHLENRKATLAKKRAQKIAATGQLALFGGVE